MNKIEWNKVTPDMQVLDAGSHYIAKAKNGERFLCFWSGNDGIAQKYLSQRAEKLVQP